jgi:hypothetical protein
MVPKTRVKAAIIWTSLTRVKESYVLGRTPMDLKRVKSSGGAFLDHASKAETRTASVPLVDLCVTFSAKALSTREASAFSFEEDEFPEFM